MTIEEIHILSQPDVAKILIDHIDQDPLEFALESKYNNFPIPLLSTQLKYLQRAKKKLPAYYEAGCILPPRAYEQSSSESTARLKSYQGNRLLDLTCGLGVDTYHLSQNFKEVISLEPNPVLAKAASFNFALLKCHNAEVRNQKAKDFLTEYEGLPFDLIYVDPDRRDSQGNRHIRLEDCSPNVLALMQLIRRHATRLVIKASPLFDVEEAFRLFPKSRVSVVSVENECRELLIDVSLKEKVAPIRSVTLFRNEQQSGFDFSMDKSTETNQTDQPFILPLPPFYLLEPDVAFYKASCVPGLFSKYFPEEKGFLSHPQGFFFLKKAPAPGFPGRVFKINEVLPFKPKDLKRRFKRIPANLVKRYFPYSIKAIRQQTGIREGGNDFLVFTQWENKKWVMLGERIISD